MKRAGKILPGLSLALIGMLSLAASAKADVDQTFDLAWSGVALGNTATATGTITLDLTLVNNPGITDQDGSPFVTDFSITISNASSGNGTFGFSDFNGLSTNGGFQLYTGSGTLDFDQQLVGQATPGGLWGSTHNGATGDFNIFSNGAAPTAPSGTFFFQLTTDDGTEDTMNLTSFAPAVSTVPEPSSVILLASLLLAAAFLTRKRIARRG